jgi:hypothetical protein
MHPGDRADPLQARGGRGWRREAQRVGLELA